MVPDGKRSIVIKEIIDYNHGLSVKHEYGTIAPKEEGRRNVEETSRGQRRSHTPRAQETSTSEEPRLKSENPAHHSSSTSKIGKPKNHSSGTVNGTAPREFSISLDAVKIPRGSSNSSTSSPSSHGSNSRSNKTQAQEASNFKELPTEKSAMATEHPPSSKSNNHSSSTMKATLHSSSRRQPADLQKPLLPISNSLNQSNWSSRSSHSNTTQSQEASSLMVTTGKSKKTTHHSSSTSIKAASSHARRSSTSILPSDIQKTISSSNSSHRSRTSRRHSSSLSRTTHAKEASATVSHAEMSKEFTKHHSSPTIKAVEPQAVPSSASTRTAPFHGPISSSTSSSFPSQATAITAVENIIQLGSTRKPFRIINDDGAIFPKCSLKLKKLPDSIVLNKNQERHKSPTYEELETILEILHGTDGYSEEPTNPNELGGVASCSMEKQPVLLTHSNSNVTLSSNSEKQNNQLTSETQTNSEAMNKAQLSASQTDSNEPSHQFFTFSRKEHMPSKIGRKRKPGNPQPRRKSFEKMYPIYYRAPVVSDLKRFVPNRLISNGNTPTDVKNENAQRDADDGAQLITRYTLQNDGRVTHHEHSTENMPCIICTTKRELSAQGGQESSVTSESNSKGKALRRVSETEEKDNTDQEDVEESEETTDGRVTHHKHSTENMPSIIGTTKRELSAQGGEESSVTSESNSRGKALRREDIIDQEDIEESEETTDTENEDGTDDSVIDDDGFIASDDDYVDSDFSVNDDNDQLRSFNRRSTTKRITRNRSMDSSPQQRRPIRRKKADFISFEPPFTPEKFLSVVKALRDNPDSPYRCPTKKCKKIVYEEVIYPGSLEIYCVRCGRDDCLSEKPKRKRVNRIEDDEVEEGEEYEEQKKVNDHRKSKYGHRNNEKRLSEQPKRKRENRIEHEEQKNVNDHRKSKYGHRNNEKRLSEKPKRKRENRIEDDEDEKVNDHRKSMCGHRNNEKRFSEKRKRKRVNRIEDDEDEEGEEEEKEVSGHEWRVNRIEDEEDGKEAERVGTVNGHIKSKSALQLTRKRKISPNNTRINYCNGSRKAKRKRNAVDSSTFANTGRKSKKDNAELIKNCKSELKKMLTSYFNKIIDYIYKEEDDEDDDEEDDEGDDEDDDDEEDDEEDDEDDDEEDDEEEDVEEEEDEDEDEEEEDEERRRWHPNPYLRDYPWFGSL